MTLYNNAAVNLHLRRAGFASPLQHTQFHLFSTCRLISNNDPFGGRGVPVRLKLTGECDVLALFYVQPPLNLIFLRTDVNRLCLNNSFRWAQLATHDRRTPVNRARRVLPD